MVKTKGGTRMPKKILYECFARCASAVFLRDNALYRHRVSTCVYVCVCSTCVNTLSPSLWRRCCCCCRCRLPPNDDDDVVMSLLLAHIFFSEPSMLIKHVSISYILYIYILYKAHRRRNAHRAQTKHSLPFPTPRPCRSI